MVEPDREAEVDAGDVFAAIEDLRIPVEYLAGFLAAGDPEPVRIALRRLLAMRAYKRAQQLGGDVEAALAGAAGLSRDELEAMFRQVAIGDYDDRYVIPRAHPEAGSDVDTLQGTCGLSFADERETGAGGDGGFDLRVWKP
jgi:nitrate reductase beta subunit